MLFSFIYDLKEFVICKIGALAVGSGELVCREPVAEDDLLNFVERIGVDLLAFKRYFRQREFIREVINDDDISVKLVKDIRHGRLFCGNINIFEIPDSVVSHVAEQPAGDVF